MSDEDPKQKQRDESLQTKIDEFNLFLEELESEWIDETEEAKPEPEPEPVKEVAEVAEPETKKVVKDTKPIPKPRPVDPSTQEIHVDLETGEVTFDDLEGLEDLESPEVGQEVLDELLDADVSETIEIDDVQSQIAAMKATVEPIEITADEVDAEEDEDEDEIIFGRIEKPKNPEQFAHGYLFARFPINFLLILIPQAIGLIVILFVNQSFVLPGEEEGIIFGDIIKYQNDLIDTYLLAVKLSLVILLAFFLCYRWSTMQNDGSYGYWLTQGVNRRRFFVGTMYKFIFVIYAGIFVGLLSLIYLNGIYLEFLDFIMLNLLVISHIFLLISVGIIIGVFTKNPESASLFFIIASGINYAFNTSEASIWNKILQSDVQYKAEAGDIWLSLFASIGLSIILTIVSLRVHLRLDMEL